MSQYDIASIVLSSIALIISVIPLFIGLVRTLKNRLTTKTLQVELFRLKNTFGVSTDWIHGDLTITNQTKNEFTITRIVVIAKGQQCKVWQARERFLTNHLTSTVSIIPPIRLMAHDAIIVDFYIECPFRIEEPSPATLSLITPYQRLNYSITLPIYTGEYDRDDE